MAEAHESSCERLFCASGVRAMRDESNRGTRNSPSIKYNGKPIHISNAEAFAI